MNDCLGKPKIESISYIFFGEISNANSIPLKELQIEKCMGIAFIFLVLKGETKSRKLNTATAILKSDL